MLIGYMYYFLVSVVNLVETKADESPIIDEKGSILGKVSYSMGIELLDGEKPLNILKYNSLNDVVGKRLKLAVELKKAQEIPEKWSFEVVAKYNWLDDDSTEFTTKVIDGEGKSQRNPVFGYRQEHVIDIDDDLISRMIESTLRIGIFGKVDQKQRLAKDGVLHAIEEVHEGDDGEGSPRKAFK